MGVAKHTRKLLSAENILYCGSKGDDQEGSREETISSSILEMGVACVISCVDITYRLNVPINPRYLCIMIAHEMPQKYIFYVI